MAQIWREPFDRERHVDFMRSAQLEGVPVLTEPGPPWVYFVQEAGMTLQFVSVEQLREARDYFALQPTPPTRLPGIRMEHYWQRWFERLPAGWNKAPKRKRMLAALDRALVEFDS